MYQVYPVSRTTSEERAEGGVFEGVFLFLFLFLFLGGEVGGKGFPTALGRIDVGACYTRSARSRRWCGWWGRRGRRGGRGGGSELELRCGWLEI